jgi:dipeptidyl aminopeptidase/acylaminoacyl peptidase
MEGFSMERQLTWAVLAHLIPTLLFAATISGCKDPGEAVPDLPIDVLSVSASSEARPISVADAIEMVRIEDYYGYNTEFVAFSPDGSKFATVIWRGDLEDDVNMFSLIVFDVEEALANPRQIPVPVLSIPFEGDEKDQAATPIDQLSFLADNRTVVFLGTRSGEPRQVHAVDIDTGRLRALTRHPTAVKEYAAAMDGTVRFYAAAAPDDADTARVNRFRWDGISPYDWTMVPDLLPTGTASSTMRASEPQQIRQYFIPTGGGDGEPSLVFDSRQSRRSVRSVWERAADTASGLVPRGSLVSEQTLGGVASFSVDPKGRYAVMWPYILGNQSVDELPHEAWDDMNLYAKSLAAYYGLVDLTSGTIQTLLDVLFVPFLARDGGEVWAPDGRSILVKTLLPLDASPVENEARAGEPAQWLEIEVPSGEYRQVDVPEGWSIIRWDTGSGDLILRKQDSLATMDREDDTWGTPRDIGVIAGFNRRHPAVTNGRIVVGVKDSLTVPPELAAYDLSSGEMTILTDLNPQLRNRIYGEVEQIRIRTRYDTTSAAWVIKPVDFEPGTRYPLVVLHKDEGSRPWDRSYLIDGQFNLSGHAIQPLAGLGFMVMFIGEPPAIRPLMETPEEGRAVRANTEEAIRLLAERGWIDPERVGVSGWSRAGYYVDYLLINSTFPYAAATQIDGGSRDYNDGGRVFTDGELERIRAPLLFEPHGIASLITVSSMTDRMWTMGKPIDILYFETAPHSTKQPRHRWRSLNTHVDWWRFWLQGYEDPDLEKASQYERWRALREAGG